VLTSQALPAAALRVSSIKGQGRGLVYTGPWLGPGELVYTGEALAIAPLELTMDVCPHCLGSRCPAEAAPCQTCEVSP
jgi:hypothetical protein